MFQQSQSRAGLQHAGPAGAAQCPVFPAARAMTPLCTTIALFSDSLRTEAGVRALRQAGFDLRRLSIVGRNYHKEEHVAGVIDRGDGPRYWGRFGGLWSSLSAVPGASALLLFPGVGQVVILGPLVNAVSAALVEAGSSPLAAALASLGLAAEAVERYEQAICAGRFAVLAQGGRGEADVAHWLLRGAGALDVREHVPPEDLRASGVLHCVRSSTAAPPA
jgi:hypothetical protein